MKTRTFIPCWRCGATHRNPMSSSLCEACGPIVAEENRKLREEAEKNSPFATPGFYWVLLDFGGWVPAELDDDYEWHPAGVDKEDVNVVQIGDRLEPPS